jgi:hypothetical protein
MTLRQLTDRAEIGDVLLRYFRGCDRWDARLIRDAFFEDATLDYGPFFRGGLEEFMTYAEGPEALGGFDRTMHFVGNLLIDLDGDAGHTETYVIAHHTTKPEHAWAGALVVVYMRYVDRFERRDGRWAIADRTVVFEWVRRDTGGGFEELAPDALGRRDREDAVYPDQSGAPATRT